MWTHEESIETTALPPAVWRLFADVSGWPRWNAGIARIELFGAFAEGSTFSMQLPGSETFTSTLIDVRENVRFTDETIVDGTSVLVTHELFPLATGGTRIVYRTQVSGESANEIGAMVTADFPAVLAALKARVEGP